MNNKLSITNIIIIINVLIFFISRSDHFLLYFGLNPYTILNPINWITSMFLHANLIHLFMNMLALYFLGNELEKNLNKINYLILYFLSGLVGSLFSVIFILLIGGEYINVIGASGAIFGLFAYISYIRNDLKNFYIQVIAFHALILFTNMPIAWYAHLGGIIAGIILFKYHKNRLFL